ncbi:Putative membrane-bound redox modulator Alx [Planctomycetaceae bacterium]|nr:Putative membrane-bound redox modulator Alx [Planctomycetaceae bacterium]
MLAILQTEGPLWWIGFNVFVLAMLAVDLLVFNRKAHEVRVREALAWSVVWISLALAFAGLIYYTPELGPERAMEYTVAWVLEKALSVDNLFIFVLIFATFKVPAKYQHKMLFWGVLGALVMRAGFILAGSALVNEFKFVLYFFGALLVFTGLKLLFAGDKEPHPEKNIAFRLIKKMLPVYNGDHEGKFFKRVNGKFHVTQLFIVLILIEITDVIFAIDSIPAVLIISQDPFIVYTSNVFAILGLRALYFALAAIMGLFHYLKYGLGLVLSFIGAKMLAPPVAAYFWPDLYTDAKPFHLDIRISLGVIFGVLGVAIAASLIFPKKVVKPEEKELPPVEPKFEEPETPTPEAAPTTKT